MLAFLPAAAPGDRTCACSRISSGGGKSRHGRLHLPQPQHLQHRHGAPGTCLPASNRRHVTSVAAHAEPPAPPAPPDVPPHWAAAAAAALLGVCAILANGAPVSRRRDPAGGGPHSGSKPDQASPSLAASSSANPAGALPGATLPTSPAPPAPKPPAASSSYTPPVPSRSGSGSRQYQRALARTQQSMCLSTAIGLLKRGEPAKAHQELLRAVIHNSACRMPCPEGTHEREAYLELYHLHLRSCQSGAGAGAEAGAGTGADGAAAAGAGSQGFALLLQLQEMMCITPDEAEALELHVLNDNIAFSI